MFTDFELKSINVGHTRTNDFRIDPNVKSNPVSSTGYQDYRYDRGHLFPAAEMVLNLTSISETFSMSNTSPMIPAFNSSIWSSAEAWVRSSALSNAELFMFTGLFIKGSCGTLSGGIIAPCTFYATAFKGGSNPKIITFFQIQGFIL